MHPFRAYAAVYYYFGMQACVDLLVEHENKLQSCLRAGRHTRPILQQVPVCIACCCACRPEQCDLLWNVAQLACCCCGRTLTSRWFCLLHCQVQAHTLPSCLQTAEVQCSGVGRLCAQVCLRLVSCACKRQWRQSGLSSRPRFRLEPT